MKDLIKYLTDYLATEIIREPNFQSDDLHDWLVDGFDAYQDQNDIKCNLAAAPALLEACKMAHTYRLNGNCNPADLMELDNRLAAAIAKAS